MWKLGVRLTWSSIHIHQSGLGRSENCQSNTSNNTNRWTQEGENTTEARTKQNGALVPFILFLDIFFPPCAVNIESSYFQQVVVMQWLLEKKSHTSRLDNKTGALTEGGCSCWVDFRPRNERTEGDDFENHPEHDARRTARLPITAATQWYSVLTFIL